MAGAKVLNYKLHAVKGNPKWSQSKTSSASWDHSSPPHHPILSFITISCLIITFLLLTGPLSVTISSALRDDSGIVILLPTVPPAPITTLHTSPAPSSPSFMPFTFACCPWSDTANSLSPKSDTVKELPTPQPTIRMWKGTAAATAELEKTAICSGWGNVLGRGAGHRSRVVETAVATRTPGRESN